MSETLIQNPSEPGNAPVSLVTFDQKYPTLDKLSIRKALLVFRAINHPLRLAMIRMIQNNNKVSVTEIFVELRIEQSVASQHLAILRRAGLVLPEREGKFMYYKPNENKLQLINKVIQDLLK